MATKNSAQVLPQNFGHIFAHAVGFNGNFRKKLNNELHDRQALEAQKAAIIAAIGGLSLELALQLGLEFFVAGAGVAFTHLHVYVAVGGGHAGVACVFFDVLFGAKLHILGNTCVAQPVYGGDF